MLANNNPDVTLLREDLNLIIKAFSYSIQDRIEELEGARNTLYRKAIIEQAELDAILGRYVSYRIQNIKEVRYVQKFCQRIIEVFTYFKAKSKISQLLALLEEKIVSDMDHILSNHPIALDSILQLVFGIMRKPLVPNPRKRLADMFAQNNNTNVVPSMAPQQHKRRNTSSAVPKLNTSSSNANIKASAICSALPSKNESKKGCLILSSQQKGQASMSNAGKRFRVSETEMLRLYHPLTLDRVYLQRCCSNLSLLQKDAFDKLLKDMLKKNEKISQQINEYAKKKNNSNNNSSTAQSSSSNNNNVQSLSNKKSKSISVHTQQPSVANMDPEEELPRKSFNNHPCKSSQQRRDSIKVRTPLDVTQNFQNLVQPSTWQQFNSSSVNPQESKQQIPLLSNSITNTRKYTTSRPKNPNDPLYNNWATKRENSNRRKVLQEITPSSIVDRSILGNVQNPETNMIGSVVKDTEAASYNFCLKESNKLQQHRKFRKIGATECSGANSSAHYPEGLGGSIISQENSNQFADWHQQQQQQQQQQRNLSAKHSSAQQKGMVEMSNFTSKIVRMLY